MTLLLLLDVAHAVNEEGVVAPLLRLVSTSENWGGSHNYREGVH